MNDFKNVKHSKYKNTGILFELLVRQTTVDALDSKDSSVAIDLIKKYFGKNRILWKELSLYKEVMDTKFSDNEKAKELISETITAREHLSNVKLKREKYNLIKEIKENFNIDQFFRSKIDNYKVLASIYMLFEAATSDDSALQPSKKVECKSTLVEHITRDKKDKELVTEDNVIEDYKKQNEDLRLLSYKIMLDKFNEKYQGLDSNQKNLLREYIYNVSNTNDFREYVNGEVDKIVNELAQLSPKIDDKGTRIKVEGVAENIEKIKQGKAVKEEQILQLMRYYELLKEVKKVVDCPKEEKLNG